MAILTGSANQASRPYIASAWSVLGAVYFHVGRIEEAEFCARNSVELGDASLGPEHPRMALYLTNYAVILKAAGRKNEAKAARKRADEILALNPTAGSGGYTVNVASLH
jgi:tetratricopeptide (TPR) repeat protein